MPHVTTEIIRSDLISCSELVREFGAEPDPSGGIITPGHIGYCHHPELLTDERRAQRNCWY